MIWHKKNITMKNIFFLFISLMAFNITVAQNVGIGTTTPQAKLDVNGTLRVNDGTQGANKILVSNATGIASWQSIATVETNSSGGSSQDSPVWIGCTPWATKNLDVTTYRDGTPIPLVTDAAAWAALTTGAYCYYFNNPANDSIYGKLYNWYAVNSPHGLAPEGWHIPSDFEWTTLENTLGGSSVAGGPMKEMGITNWTSPNLGATNLCNFSADPGGYRAAVGGFHDKGEYGYWWSATSGDSNIAWSRKLNYNDTEIVGAGTEYNVGYSVRCVKD
jgi:uncharacterized protein (TIGR02145 family)